MSFAGTAHWVVLALAAAVLPAPAAWAQPAEETRNDHREVADPERRTAELFDDFLAPHDRFTRVAGEPRVGYEPGYGMRPAQRLTAWLWAPQTTDTTKLAGRSYERRTTFNDLLDDLIVPPAGLRYEGMRGWWTWVGRVEYLQADDVVGTPGSGLSADVKYSQLLVEAGARWRVFEWSWARPHPQVDIGWWVDLGLSGRYWLRYENVEFSDGTDDVLDTQMLAGVATFRLGAQFTQMLSATAEIDAGSGGRRTLHTRGVVTLQVRFDAHFGLELGWQAEALELPVHRSRRLRRLRQFSQGPFLGLSVYW